MRDSVFISYRWGDVAAGTARRLADRLQASLGNRRVFLDTSAIRPGDSIPGGVLTGLVTVRVMLVVIGNQWLAAARTAEQRDWVWLELELALQSAKHVTTIPVLVDGAALPTVAQLPPQVAGLAGLKVMRLSADAFDYDVGLILHFLGELGIVRRSIGNSIAVALSGLLVGIALLVWLLQSRANAPVGTPIADTTGPEAQPTTETIALAPRLLAADPKAEATPSEAQALPASPASAEAARTAQPAVPVCPRARDAQRGDDTVFECRCPNDRRIVSIPIPTSLAGKYLQDHSIGTLYEDVCAP